MKATRIPLLLALPLILACGAPSLGQPADPCAARMKQVFKLLQQYAQFHARQLPQAMSVLYYEAYTDKLTLFVCPASGKAITRRTEIDAQSDYALAARELPAGRHVALLRETENRHGGTHHVLYSDGTVALEAGGTAPTTPGAAAGPATTQKPPQPGVTATQLGETRVEGPAVTSKTPASGAQGAVVVLNGEPGADGGPEAELVAMMMKDRAYDHAAEFLRDLIAGGQNTGRIHAELALALLRQGKRDEAIIELRRARKLGFNDANHLAVKELGAAAGIAAGPTTPPATEATTQPTVATTRGGFGLSRIEVSRTYREEWMAPGVRVAYRPGKETCPTEQGAFQVGWDYRWPDDTRANVNRGLATLTLTRIPTSVEPGTATTLGATLKGDWNTSGFGVERDHTIHLEGAAGGGEWSKVENPSAAYQGSLEATNLLTVPQPENGQIALSLKVSVRFGGDHHGEMEVRLIYAAGETPPEAASVGAPQPQVATNRSQVATNGSQVATNGSQVTTTQPQIAITGTDGMPPFGVEVKLNQGKVLITSVKDDSLAAFMSLKPGDEITQLNGKPLDDAAFNQLLALLRGKSCPQLTLTIIRAGGGDMFVVTIPAH